MTRHRQSHNKSRNGCSNCKKLHIKCDEQGPPCANCISRKRQTECSYNRVAFKRSPEDVNTSVTPRADTSVNQLAPKSVQIAVKHMSSTSTPPFFGSAPEISSLLQLELMHQWSTKTYKSFAFVPPEAEHLQIDTPRQALRHTFLLDGIMTLAALDIASDDPESPRAKWYTQQAMQLFDSSAAPFRAQLSHIDDNNVLCVIHYSPMIAWTQFAMITVGSPLRHSTIDTVMTAFDLFCGTLRLFTNHFDTVMKSSYGSVLTYALDNVLSPRPSYLDVDTELAFARLYTLIDVGLSNDNQQSMYLLSTQYLYQYFLQDQKQKVNGLFFAFPAVAGPGFTQAVKDRQPMALLLLMHLALLLDRFAGFTWWTKGIAGKLVAEAKDILLRANCSLSLLPEFYQSITWASSRLRHKADADYLCPSQITELV